jgi:hypothetical protein
MRGPVSFPSGFDRSVAVVAGAISGTGSKRAWLIVISALVAGILDRFAVLCVADTVFLREAPWRTDLAWVAAALAGTFLFGRWAASLPRSGRTRALPRSRFAPLRRSPSPPLG